ncbi:hypothetical protein EYF80_060520 [Liparis tanakae]|uniref:Uncharacterized protein n=1 Tax=Liparis tanakae TaxID=230148 RepID=A0A4Z2EL94_9TELE|nr:hypothetical protein EYF80_060520 [Liparis tanakae]
MKKRNLFIRTPSDSQYFPRKPRGVRGAGLRETWPRGGDCWRERRMREDGVALASSKARVLYLRLGVPRGGKSAWKNGLFSVGGRFSASLAGEGAGQPLFWQEASVREGAWPEEGGGRAAAAACVWLSRALRLKSAFTSTRPFWSSSRIWS